MIGMVLVSVNESPRPPEDDLATSFAEAARRKLRQDASQIARCADC
jgi:hypothetical protein